MKEFLDKTGLEYFYKKLCSVFVMLGSVVKTTVSANDIESALGYSPVSLSQLTLTTSDISSLLNSYITNFNKLKTYTNSLGTNIDTVNSTLTTYGTWIDSEKTAMNAVQTTLNAHDASITNVAQKYDAVNEELTTVGNKLDAANANITSLITRTNSQGVYLNSIEQRITDAESSIDLTVSMSDVNDTVTAKIQEKVFNDDGTLKSSIALAADQITLGTIGSNVTFGGSLDAPSGTIGGWTIGENDIHATNDDNEVTISSNFDSDEIFAIQMSSDKNSVIVDPTGLGVMKQGLSGDVVYYDSISITPEDGFFVSSGVDNSSKIKLNIDGSGYLANNNFSWNADGDITAKNLSVSNVTIKNGGSIGGFELDGDNLVGDGDDSTMELQPNYGKIQFYDSNSCGMNASGLYTHSGENISSNEYDQKINSDGSGSLANGNIRWKSDGTVYFKSNSKYYKLDDVITALGSNITGSDSI